MGLPSCRAPHGLLAIAALLAAGIAVLAGCAPFGGSFKGSEPSSGPPAAEAPDEWRLVLSLRPGQSWTSRFVSTSEVRRFFPGAKGEGPSRARTVGLELVARQSVKDVRGGRAVIEVDERAARILQEGRFVDAPFRRFGPPNPIVFTVELATGAVDFSEAEKAYGRWMEEVKAGPAAEILGKSFRADAYVAQLRELYGKPFARFAGKTVPRKGRASVSKEFFIPFLGPGAAMGPVAVDLTMRAEGLEVVGDRRTLRVAGEFGGEGPMGAGEVAARLAEWGAAGSAAETSSRTVRGSFRSFVDLLSGREIQGTSQVLYTAAVSAGGKTFREEVAAKFILEPAE